jgi:hypothetical protein
MNNTRESQELDVDIQQVRKDFKSWRRRQVRWLVTAISLVFLFGVSLAIKNPTVKGFFGSLFTTLEGWMALAFWVYFYIILFRLLDNKYHFQCPAANCKMAIDLHDPWVCPFCPNNNVSYPGYQRPIYHILFFRCTIFDKCAARGHVQESYKCMSSKHRDGFVFELIPGGNRNLPAYKYEPSPPVQLVQPPPPEQPRTGEIIPRDRNFFG